MTKKSIITETIKAELNAEVKDHTIANIEANKEEEKMSTSVVTANNGADEAIESNTSLTTKLYKLLEESPEFKEKLLTKFPDINKIKINKTDAKRVASKLNPPSVNDLVHKYKRFFNVDISKVLANDNFFLKKLTLKNSSVLFATHSNEIFTPSGIVNMVPGSYITIFAKSPMELEFANDFKIKFSERKIESMATFFNGKELPLGIFKIVYWGNETNNESWKKDSGLHYFEILMEIFYESKTTSKNLVSISL